MDLKASSRKAIPLVLDSLDCDLIDTLSDGLPLSPRPYQEIGRSLGLSEAGTIARIETLRRRGVIKRFGIIVRHRELGYRANAMVVWDIPDTRVGEIGTRLGACSAVSLCYRRPRRPPNWNYNLFCMLHGKERRTVLDLVQDISRDLGLEVFEHQVLFSQRRFKQCGARFGLGQRYPPDTSETAHHG